VVLAETSNAGTAELWVFGVILLVVVARGRAIGRVFATEGAAVPEQPRVRVPKTLRNHALFGHGRWWLIGGALLAAVVAPQLSFVSSEGNRFIVLDDGQRNEQDASNGEKTLSRFTSFRPLAGEKMVDPREVLPPKARPTLQLLREPSALAHGELVWRLGLILAAANMLLLGIGMSASNPRHASNWNLLFALLGFFAYYNIITLTQAWVGAGKIGLGAVLLATHGVAFALALALLWWRENGMRRVAAVRRRRRRRRATTPSPA